MSANGDADVTFEQSTEVEFQRDKKAVDFLCERCELPRGQAMLSSRTVVLLLGATSSGKTSLVNAFYGVQLKRTSAASADSKFTIIEAVDEKDFAALCAKRAAASSGETTASSSDDNDDAELSEDELAMPKPNARDPSATEWTQRRLNRLFLPLSSIECVHRYGTVLKTLSEDVLCESEPFVGLLVNGRYVRQAGAQNVVVIDSEGLDFNSSQNVARDFPLRLQLLDLFVRLSDHIAFMLRAGSLTDAVSSVQCLDLLLGYNALPPQKQSQYLTRLMPLLSAGAKAAIRATVPGGALVAPALDLLLSVVGSSSLSSSSSSTGQQDGESPMAAKVSFVISQMDLCADVADEQAQVFTLGMLLGRHLHKVVKAHSDALYPISIPAPNRRHFHANALPSLLAALFSPAYTHPKRIVRELELRTRLHECSELVNASYSLWLEFALRRLLCGFPSVPVLLARSHARQTYFSSTPAQPTFIRARL